MKTPYQRFWLLLKPDSKEIYQVYTYAFFKGLIALSLPIGIQSIINFIQGGSVSASWMVLVFIVTLGIAMGGYMQLMQMRITETIQQKIFTRAAFDFTYRVATVALNGALNAGIIAAQILSVENKEIRNSLITYKEKLKNGVMEKVEKLKVI